MSVDHSSQEPPIQPDTPPEPHTQAQPQPWWHHYRPSQALCVSIAVGAMLLALFVMNWVTYRRQPQRVAWTDYMQWSQCLALSLLALVICAMTYWLVRLWHEELPAGDSTIEAAWQAGIKRLRRRGQNLEQVPLFVILDARPARHHQQLFEQSNVQLLEPIAPADPDAPIHWALTDQGVWLLIRTAGTYTRLSERLAMRGHDSAHWRLSPAVAGEFETARPIPAGQTSLEADKQRNILQPNFPQPPLQEPDTRVGLDVLPERSARQALSMVAVGQPTAPQLYAHHPQSRSPSTHVVVEPSMAIEHSHDSQTAISQPSETSSTATSNSHVASETLQGLEHLIDQVDQAVSSEPPSSAGTQASAGSQASGDKRPDGVRTSNLPEEERPPVANQPAWQTELAFQASLQPMLLSSVELSVGQKALEEICRRLRSARRSTAPINGVIALVTTRSLVAGPVTASQLGLALRSDLKLIQETCQLQTPITILVDSVEQLPGATELVRRGGVELAKRMWMGASFPVRYQPEKSLLAHLCKLTCGQLETAVYGHLKAAGSLNAVGNHQLFQLLITCRGRLLPSLQAFVCEALSLENGPQTPHEPFLCAGVHLIATGQKATERAWVNCALVQVQQYQNFLCWTAERMRGEKRLMRFIQLLKVTCLLLAVTLLVAWWKGLSVL